MSILRKATGPPVWGQGIARPADIVDQPLPVSWQSTTYGPGFPIQPLTEPLDDGLPREIDYPPSVNATIQPRAAYGLMPFAALGEAWESVPDVKMLVHLLTREFSIFTPAIVDGEGADITQDSPLRFLTEKPDGRLPWDMWVTRLLQSLMVFDAPTLFHNVRDKRLEYVDGTTIFVLVDNHGHVPEPPSPAYTQIIKGIPFDWYTSEEIAYRPRFRRYNAPYGMSPLEMAWGWVLVIANILGFELSHYREGNMPEGLMIPTEDMTLEQVAFWEATYNSRMSGGPAERNRIRLMPGKWGYIPTKKPDFPKELYSTAKDNLALSFGIPASEYGSMPGKGLGGKGFMDVMQDTLFRMGLSPLKVFIEAVVNEFAIKIGGGPEARFELTLPTQGLDPASTQNNTVQQFINGCATLNEARAVFGLDAIPGGDILMVIRNGQIVSVSEFLKTGVVPAPTPEGEAAAASSDSTPSDTKLARAIIEAGRERPSVIVFPIGSGDGQVTKQKEIGGDLPRREGGVAMRKVTGVSADDDQYFGAPIIEATTLEWPTGGHANDVNIVAIAPPDLPARPGVWKPLGGENVSLIQRIGGFQYLREEAAYLLDRTMVFYLVPVAYAARVNGDVGAVCYYVKDNKPRREVMEYSRYWLERAAVLEYLDGSIDRHHGNWLTHPTDPQRPIMIDNGLTFPVTNMPIYSPFVEACANEELSPDVIAMLRLANANTNLWHDLTHLVGDDATALVKARMERLIEIGHIEIVDLATAEQSGGTTLSDEPVHSGEDLETPPTLKT